MKRRFQSYASVRSLLIVLLAVVSAAVSLCSCDGIEEGLNAPDTETNPEELMVLLPTDALISAELPEDKIMEALERVWMGLFSSDGNLKMEFRLGKGISLIDGKMNLNLTRGLVAGGDILAVVKHTASAIAELEISSLEELRNVEFSVEDIQKSESEVLYAEKTLTEEECRIGKILKLNLSRPFAEITITDQTENIESISMNSCPSTGRLGDALIPQPSSLDTRTTSEVAGQQFMSDGDGNFHLYVPYIKFASNEAKSDDRALTLSLNNGTTSTIYLTRHEDGKPVDIKDTDSTWQALWPDCRYTFNYNVAVEEKPKFEIKDKIRVIWNYKGSFGKFSANNINISGIKGANPKFDYNTDRVSYEFDISDISHVSIPYYMIDLYDYTVSVTGDLIQDAIEINYYDEITEFFLTRDMVLTPVETFRFYCKDFDLEGKKIEISKIQYNQKTDVPVKIDKRGYKYADFTGISISGIDIDLICNDIHLNVLDYFKDYTPNPYTDYNEGIVIKNDCVLEEHDGKIYQCFYFN